MTNKQFVGLLLVIFGAASFGAFTVITHIGGDEAIKIAALISCYLFTILGVIIGIKKEAE